MVELPCWSCRTPADLELLPFRDGLTPLLLRTCLYLSIKNLVECSFKVSTEVHVDEEVEGGIGYLHKEDNSIETDVHVVLFPPHSDLGVHEPHVEQKHAGREADDKHGGNKLNHFDDFHFLLVHLLRFLASCFIFSILLVHF